MCGEANAIETEDRRNRLPHKSFRAVVMLTIAATVVSGCLDLQVTASRDEIQEPVRPVLVQEARYQLKVEAQTYPGVLIPRYESDLSFQVGGRIVSRSVEVGDYIRKGQELARLDDVDLKLRVRAAEANAASIEAELVNARLDLSRKKKLVARNAVPKAAYDDAMATATALEQRYASALSQLEIARNEHGYGVLIAPEDAVVTKIYAETGQVVGAGQFVLTAARTDEYEVAIDVPESRLHSVVSATTVRATLWSDQMSANTDVRKFPLEIREVGATANAETRTYPVKLAISNVDNTLRFGMTADVHFETAIDVTIAKLPMTAVFQDGEEPAVWVFDNETTSVSLSRVQIDAYGDEFVTISGGVPEGALVVTAGVHRLTEGMKVARRDDPRVEVMASKAL